jgi:preprotein translocase subunit SecA
MNFLRKLFDNNERDVARYRKVVEKVNALEPQFKALNDEQLKGKTEEFRARVREVVGDEAQYKTRKEMTEAYNKALDDILPEAFAACRELIDAIKLRVPIWKRETYTDGHGEWIEGCRCASPH